MTGPIQYANNLLVPGEHFIVGHLGLDKFIMPKASQDESIWLYNDSKKPVIEFYAPNITLAIWHCTFECQMWYNGKNLLAGKA